MFLGVLIVWLRSTLKRLGLALTRSIDPLQQIEIAPSKIDNLCDRERFFMIFNLDNLVSALLPYTSINETTRQNIPGNGRSIEKRAKISIQTSLALVLRELQQINDPQS